MKNSLERRQHARLNAKDKAFAVITTKPLALNRNKSLGMSNIAIEVYKSDPVKMGQIIDISKGGLAFSYIDHKERTDRALKLSIVFAGSSFYLKNLCFAAVVDTETNSENQHAPFEMKRCGLRFKDLSPTSSKLLAGARISGS